MVRAPTPVSVHPVLVVSRPHTLHPTHNPIYHLGKGTENWPLLNTFGVSGFADPLAPLHCPVFTISVHFMVPRREATCLRVASVLGEEQGGLGLTQVSSHPTSLFKLVALDTVSQLVWHSLSPVRLPTP